MTPNPPKKSAKVKVLTNPTDHIKDYKPSFIDEDAESNLRIYKDFYHSRLTLTEMGDELLDLANHIYTMEEWITKI